MLKPHTHIEFRHLDGALVSESDEHAAPFPLEVGEQMHFGDRVYQVREIIDSTPREADGVVYFRRFVRMG